MNVPPADREPASAPAVCASMNELPEALCVRVFWGARRLSTHLVSDSASSVRLGSQRDAHIHLPRGRAQFSRVNGAFQCTFSAGVRGERVSRDGHREALGELVHEGQATEGKDGWSVPFSSNELVRLEAGPLRVEAVPVAAVKRPVARLDDVLDYHWLNVLLLCLFVASLFIAQAEAWALTVVDADTPSSAELSHLRRVLLIEPPKPTRGGSIQPEAVATREKIDRRTGAQGGGPAPKKPASSGHGSPTAKPSPLQGVLSALGSQNVFSNQGLGNDLSQALNAVGSPASPLVAGLGGLSLRGGPSGPGGDLERIGAPGLGTPSRQRGAGVGVLCGDKTPCKPEVEPKITDSGPTVVCAPEARVACVDPELIRKVIRSHLSQVRYCYERALQTAPSLAGRVLVNFQIGTTGTVSAAQVKKGLTSELDECLRTRVMLWVFPTSANQGLVSVSYPFVFHPSGQ